jgi:hypothetical protein
MAWPGLATGIRRDEQHHNVVYDLGQQFIAGRHAVQQDARFERAGGCPNTLSNNADRRSLASATVRTLPEHDPGDRR